jgi:hypothetical protein
MNELTLEFSEENQRQFGPCDCCGKLTNRVWGYVYRDSAAMAAYFVEWTPGHAYRSAAFDLILGKWGNDTSASHRQLAALDFRHIETGPSFMVVDAANRTISTSPLISHTLRRDEVLGKPIASEIFKIVDTIYLNDPRIAELTA